MGVGNGADTHIGKESVVELQTLFQVLTGPAFGYTKAEARAEMADMRQRIAEGEDPEEVLYEMGLEPDYVMDLL